MAAENPNGANIEDLTGKTEQFIEDNSRNLIIGIAAGAGGGGAGALRRHRGSAEVITREHVRDS